MLWKHLINNVSHVFAWNIMSSAWNGRVRCGWWNALTIFQVTDYLTRNFDGVAQKYERAISEVFGSSRKQLKTSNFSENNTR